MKVTVGIDIGQRVDNTAICVSQLDWRERSTASADMLKRLPRKPIDHHIVRYLERLPLGVSYPKIAIRLKEIIDDVEAMVYAGTLRRVAGDLQSEDSPEITVYVDATGVGQPVVDMLSAAGAKVIGVYFTHGDRRVVSVDEVSGITTITLGKAYMVARLQALLQTRRLHFTDIPEAKVLSRELLNYEVKVDTNANEKYGAFRVGEHDDLVTALGLSVQSPTRRITALASAGGFVPSQVPEWAGPYTRINGNGKSPLDQMPDLPPYTGLNGLRDIADDYRRYT